MSNNFDIAYKFTEKWEKGKVDDPADNGGRTCDGVTQKVYSEYRVSMKLPVQDVYLISEQEKHDIYYEKYWLKSKCNVLPLKIACVVFDASVNHGVVRAIKWLQELIGTEQDGVFGKETETAIFDRISQIGPEAFCDLFMARRKAFYDTIVKNNPTQQKFYKGWMNRWNDLVGYIKNIG